MSKVGFRLLLVFTGQIVLACVLYRGRALSHHPWADSDLMVFGLPLLIGTMLALTVSHGSSKRTPRVFGIVLAGAVVSSLVAAVIAFNLYGS